MAGKRKLIADELLTTERSYVESLKVARDYFLIPLTPKYSTILRGTSSGNLLKENKGKYGDKSSILTSEEHELLLNFLPILQTNQKFLEQLETLMKSWNDDSCVGGLLCEYAPLFNIYKMYANESEARTLKLGQLLEENKEFANFCKEQANVTALKGRDLASFLIMPIQRIPRYLLLAQELKKNTPSTHPDSEKLEQALEILKVVAAGVNEGIAKALKRKNVVLLQQRLIGRPNLVTPSRALMLEGKFALIKGGEEKSVFLFNDLILAATPQGEKLKVEAEVSIDSDLIIEKVGDKAIKLRSKEEELCLFSNAAQTTEWLKSLNELKTKSGVRIKSQQSTTDIKKSDGKKVSWSVKEGYLKKLAGTVSKWDVRYFVLLKTPPVLQYYHNPQDEDPRGVLLLSSDSICEVHPEKPLRFNVREQPLEKRLYKFQAESQEQRDEWVAKICEVCKIVPTKSVRRSKLSLSSLPLSTKVAIIIFLLSLILYFVTRRN